MALALACADSKLDDDDDLSVEIGDDGGGSTGGGGSASDDGGDAGGDVGGDDGGDGGEDDGGSSGTTVTSSPVCETRVAGTLPASDDPAASVLTHVLVDFFAPRGDESLTVYDASGASVPGSTAREHGGERLRFIPDAPLVPEHSYEVAIEYCDGLNDAVVFQTSGFGAPLDCDPSGATFVTNPALATVVEPRDVGELLVDALTTELALTVSDVAASSASLRLGGGTSRAQEDCFPTTDVEAAFDTPALELSSAPVMLPYSTSTGLPIESVSIAAVVAADCGALDIARVTGDIDARTATGLVLDLLGTEDPDEFCAFLPALGIECQPCVSDGAGYCVPVELAQMSTSLAPYALQPRSLEDIFADPTCASGASCSQAVTRQSWAWSALGLAVLGVVVRRRW